MDRFEIIKSQEAEVARQRAAREARTAASGPSRPVSENKPSGLDLDGPGNSAGNKQAVASPNVPHKSAGAAPTNAMTGADGTGGRAPNPHIPREPGTAPPGSMQGADQGYPSTSFDVERPVLQGAAGGVGAKVGPQGADPKNPATQDTPRDDLEELGYDPNNGLAVTSESMATGNQRIPRDDVSDDAHYTDGNLKPAGAAGAATDPYPAGGYGDNPRPQETATEGGWDEAEKDGEPRKADEAIVRRPVPAHAALMTALADSGVPRQSAAGAAIDRTLAQMAGKGAAKGRDELKTSPYPQGGYGDNTDQVPQVAQSLADPVPLKVTLQPKVESTVYVPPMQGKTISGGSLPAAGKDSFANVAVKPATSTQTPNDATLIDAAQGQSQLNDWRAPQHKTKVTVKSDVGQGTTFIKPPQPSLLRPPLAPQLPVTSPRPRPQQPTAKPGPNTNPVGAGIVNVGKVPAGKGKGRT